MMRNQCVLGLLLVGLAGCDITESLGHLDTENAAGSRATASGASTPDGPPTDTQPTFGQLQETGQEQEDANPPEEEADPEDIDTSIEESQDDGETEETLDHEHEDSDMPIEDEEEDENADFLSADDDEEPHDDPDDSEQPIVDAEDEFDRADDDADLDVDADNADSIREDSTEVDEQDGKLANATNGATSGGSIRNILPLGDSITEGVPYTDRHALFNGLTQSNYPFNFVGSHTNGAESDPATGWDRDNEGWAGWTTESVASALSGWSAHYQVDIALIHLGTNDAGGDDVEGST